MSSHESSHHLLVEAVRRRSRAVRRRSLSSHESSHHLLVEAVRRRSRAVRRRSLSSHESSHHLSDNKSTLPSVSNKFLVSGSCSATCWQ